MDGEVKVEKISMEDGRQAERHVREEHCEDEQTRIVDLYVEDNRPRKLNLSKRIVEKSRPCVYRREIETIDENGEVVDRVVESLDPEDRMKLVEHIATYKEDKAASAQASNECADPVTREDLKEAISVLCEQVSSQIASQIEMHSGAHSKEAHSKESFSVLQDHMGTRIEQNNESQISTTTWVLSMAAMALTAGLIYVLVWM